jgi:very-short-patch-repair endonuclease
VQETMTPEEVRKLMSGGYVPKRPAQRVSVATGAIEPSELTHAQHEQIDSSAVKRIAGGMKKAQLEQRFLESWRRLFAHLPAPTMQYKFHATRKWRFDFSFIDQRLAVEIDGGAFIHGGHSRGAQQQKDYEKMNNAVKLGWRVLRFNTKDMADAEAVVTFVAKVLCDAKEVV